MGHIHLDWQSMLTTHLPGSLPDVVKKHEAVFCPGFGTIKNLKATLHQKPDVSPQFMKHRAIPHVMRAAKAKEHNRLEKEGTIVPMQHSDWVAAIVPVKS